MLGTSSLLNHLIRLGKDRRLNCEAKHFSGFEIDHQFKFRRVLNREVHR